MITYYDAIDDDDDDDDDDEYTETEIAYYEKVRHHERIAFMSHHAAEAPQGFSWSVKLRLNGDVSVCRQRILEVVAIIIATPRHVWPNADQWRAMLPAWFIQQTPERTRAESQALIATTPRDQWHTLSWEFKSWIQVVRDREWSWWSYRHDGDQMIIHLSLNAWPANINTFNHIVRAAGATIVQEGHTLDTDEEENR